ADGLGKERCPDYRQYSSKSEHDFDFSYCSDRIDVGMGSSCYEKKRHTERLKRTEKLTETELTTGPKKLY
ncbi:MAG: hypothetical protein AB7H48_13025, partial [Parachlamydiales bacterium]